VRRCGFASRRLLSDDEASFSVTTKGLVRSHGNVGHCRLMRTGARELAAVDRSSGDCARSRPQVIIVMICQARAEPSDGQRLGPAASPSWLSLGSLATQSTAYCADRSRSGRR